MDFVLYICSIKLIKYKQVMDDKARIIRELAEQIEKDNELFKSLSNNQKKVVIAEDCLLRIQAEQIIPKCSTFLNHNGMLFAKKSVKDVLNDASLDIECDGCAKGGLFLSLIGRTNEFDSGAIQLGNDLYDNQHKKLLEVFTPKELAYIEFAFEGKQYLEEEEVYDEKLRAKVYIPIEFTESERQRARNFYMEYGGEFEEPCEDNGFDAYQPQSSEWYYDGANMKERLIAICENIIRNDGEFI